MLEIFSFRTFFLSLVTVIYTLSLPTFAHSQSSLSNEFFSFGGLYELKLGALGGHISYHRVSGIGGYFGYGNEFLIHQDDDRRNNETMKFGLNYTTKNREHDITNHSLYAGLTRNTFSERSGFDIEKRKKFLYEVGLMTFLRSSGSIGIFLGTGVTFGDDTSLSAIGGITFEL